jgi:hypothetical protein
MLIVMYIDVQQLVGRYIEITPNYFGESISRLLAANLIGAAIGAVGSLDTLRRYLGRFARLVFRPIGRLRRRDDQKI